jgi:hypothetical protein
LSEILEAMTERKPVEIPDEDWANTPSTVRGFVSQSMTPLKKGRAKETGNRISWPVQVLK